MGKSVTAVNRKKLADLRGQGAKKASDARVLAETAIMQAAKEYEARKQVYVPALLPEDVAKLMKDNEMEDATIVFSKNAINLFSYLFSQNMAVAVKDAMTGLQSSIEEMLERKLAQMVNQTANSMESVLGVLISKNAPVLAPVMPKEPEFIQETVEPVFVPYAEPPKAQRAPFVLTQGRLARMEAARVKYRATHKIPDDIEVLGNSKADLDRTAPYLIEVLRARAGEPVKFAVICMEVRNMHKVVWINPHHTLDAAMELDSSIKKLGAGMYTYSD